MSYLTISRSMGDAALQSRITACIAQEQIAAGGPANPGIVAGDVAWSVCAASDVEAAYASALAGENPEPGADESVVTDGMILANVQASMSP